MRRLAALTLCVFCTAPVLADEKTPPASVKITAESDARTVIRGIPDDAATERFEALAADGRIVSYVGLAAGPVGGVVFREGRLLGTLTRPQADMFYSCRGYATARHQHWAQEAGRWVDSLLAAAQPAPEIELHFTGKTTLKSIKAVLEDPGRGQVKALVEMGTNPLKIIKTLSKARKDLRKREFDEEMLEELDKLVPGDAEQRLAAVLRPQDLTFVEHGIVMAYPAYSVEYFVTQDKIQSLQQPSFLHLARMRPAVFYAPAMAWSSCVPDKWLAAVQAPAAE